MRNRDSQRLNLKVFTYSGVSTLDIRLYFSDNIVLCGTFYNQIKFSAIPVIVMNASYFEGGGKSRNKKPTSQVVKIKSRK